MTFFLNTDEIMFICFFFITKATYIPSEKHNKYKSNIIHNHTKNDNNYKVISKQSVSSHSQCMCLYYVYVHIYIDKISW